MKSLVVVVSFVNLAIILNAQQPLENSDTVELVSSIEILPKWIKGTNRELIEHIEKQIEFPADTTIVGTTVLFVVDTLGNVQDPRIRLSLLDSLDAQLLDLIKNERFEPGMQRRKKTAFKMNLPFKINTE